MTGEPGRKLHLMKNVFRTKMARYGGLAVLSYNVLAFPTLCAFYILVDKQGLTEQDFLKQGNRMKKWCGLNVDDDQKSESWISELLNQYEWTRSPENRVKVGNFLIAYTGLRIISPIYVGASAMIATRIAKRLW